MVKLAKVRDLVLPDSKIKVLSNLGGLIRAIQKTVPKDGGNFPLYYVDPRVILEYLTTENFSIEKLEDIPQRIISDSMVIIEWDDGIPIVEGYPIWEKLDCEPMPEYKLFKLYRESIKVGDTSRRSFENLSKTQDIKVRALYALSKVYHWRLRVKAFDLYRFEILEAEKNNIIKNMETTHRQAAENIFGKCVKYFEGLSEEELKKVSPKDMLSYFKEGIKLWRMSLGMPDKIVSKEETKKSEKIERIEIGKIESRTLNINEPQKKKEYLQDVIDILDSAGALPKQLEDKKDEQQVNN